MVKSAGSGRSAALYVMPDFFAHKIPQGRAVNQIWPEDGALASPVTLLVKKEKIVLMTTHAPLLALSGSRRLIIRNGRIAAVLETSAEEGTVLWQLDRLVSRLANLRNRIRQGKRLSAEQ